MKDDKYGAYHDVGSTSFQFCLVGRHPSASEAGGFFCKQNSTDPFDDRRLQGTCCPHADRIPAPSWPHPDPMLTHAARPDPFQTRKSPACAPTCFFEIHKPSFHMLKSPNRRSLGLTWLVFCFFDFFFFDRTGHWTPAHAAANASGVFPGFGVPNRYVLILCGPCAGPVLWQLTMC